MPCNSPLEGYRGESGKLELGNRPDLNPMTVPCGWCRACRLQRAKDWTLRCWCEAQMHEQNAFLTLTYRPEDLPPDGSVRPKHFQDFMKRLRERTGQKLRYLHCGEYGSETSRPHYHALLFGGHFEDQEYFFTSRAGNDIYRSELLEDIWKKGHATIGAVSLQSAGYVARYVMKKQVGDAAIEHYGSRHPEYATMSRRPGVGRSWFEKYWRDVYPKDYVTIDGKKHKPPRYFDELMEEKDPDLMVEVRDNRREFASKQDPEEQEDHRLAAKEYCLHERISRLHREYENANGEDLLRARLEGRRLHDTMVRAQRSRRRKTVRRRGKRSANGDA